VTEPFVTIVSIIALRMERVKRTTVIKIAIVAVAAIAAGVLAWGPVWLAPEGRPGFRDDAAQRAMSIFLLCMSLWLTNLIPLAATGLLAIALLPILGIMPRGEAFSLFGNSAVFFMLGVFLLAAALIATGLSKRLTLVFLQRFDKGPGRLVAGVLLSSAFLSMWMPEHAVAAMIFPILVEVSDTLGLKKGKSDYGKMLFLALSWGCIIGGIATFLGGARAPLALELLAQNFDGMTISFGTWLLATAPIVAIMLLVAWVMLRRTLKFDVESIQPATRMLDDRVRRLGPMSGKERRLAVLWLGTVLCWITLGHSVGLGVIAIISAVLLFVLQIVDWRQIQDYVNWGVLIMYGGAVALGIALDKTGAFHWIVQRVLDPGIPKFAILAFMVTVTIVLTEGISNSAAVAILLPVGYSLCGPVGLDPVVMTLAVATTAGLAFSLPISSPPNAICFSAGHYRVREVVRRGVVMSAVSLVVMLLMMGLYWPLLGLGNS
jgi:solute carrier family 13 (sodium-dependent dicarboxylate transporter), member 2/3/5